MAGTGRGAGPLAHLDSDAFHEFSPYMRCESAATSLSACHCLLSSGFLYPCLAPRLSLLCPRHLCALQGYSALMQHLAMLTGQRRFLSCHSNSVQLQDTNAAEWIDHSHPVRVPTPPARDQSSSLQLRRLVRLGHPLRNPVHQAISFAARS